MEKKIKILLSKVGLDTHDRGIKVLAHNLKNAGMEVVYLGLYQTPESIVNASIQEDVDVIGLSCLSGEHIFASEKIAKLIKERNANDMLFIIGGPLPVEEISVLKEMGVGEVFRPGSQIEDIVKYIKKNVRRSNK